MAIDRAQNTIYALVEHDPMVNMVQASFTWSPLVAGRHKALDRTYKMSVADQVTFEMHDSYVAHPVGVYAADNNLDALAEPLQEFVSPQLIESLQRTKEIGFMVVEATLTHANSMAFARLHLYSSVTPPGLRHACRALIQAQTHLEGPSTPQ